LDAFFLERFPFLLEAGFFFLRAKASPGIEERSRGN
jgi:hypothetical protein